MFIAFYRGLPVLDPNGGRFFESVADAADAVIDDPKMEDLVAYELGPMLDKDGNSGIIIGPENTVIQSTQAPAETPE